MVKTIRMGGPTEIRGETDSALTGAPLAYLFLLLLALLSCVFRFILLSQCLGSRKREHFNFTVDGVYYVNTRRAETTVKTTRKDRA